jgi:hypothetical protein
VQGVPGAHAKGTGGGAIGGFGLWPKAGLGWALGGPTAGLGVRVGPVLRFGPRQAAGVEGGTTDLRSC